MSKVNITYRRLTEVEANHLGLAVKPKESQGNARYRLYPDQIEDIMKFRATEEENYKPRVMIYDIETSRVTAKVWGTGKTYVTHKQLRSETTIISISWKWFGEDKIHALKWDKNHCDKEMIEKFLIEYNSADMLVGQNNDRFDNKLIHARAAKHKLYVNVHMKSFDLIKQTRRLFKLQSYSMDYVTKFLGVTHKQSHEGIHMWDMIEDGTYEEQAEYLQKMVDYNVGDIVATEAMYIRLRKYMGHKVHFGILEGKERFSSPTDGSYDIYLEQVSTTAGGAIQYLMISNTDGVQFKLSHANYIKWLDFISEEQ